MSQQQLMQELEQREEFKASVLLSASRRSLTSAEVLFLASELGVSVDMLFRDREAA